MSRNEFEDIKATLKSMQKELNVLTGKSRDPQIVIFNEAVDKFNLDINKLNTEKESLQKLVADKEVELSKLGEENNNLKTTLIEKDNEITELKKPKEEPIQNNSQSLP